METKFLLPNTYKRLGWWLFFPSLILACLVFFSGYEPDWLSIKVPSLFHDEVFFIGDKDSGNGFKIVNLTKNNIANEITGVLLLVSCMLIVFAREKDEDEMIMKLRLESLLWAAMINGLLVLFSLIFTYDFTFYFVMVFNLYWLFLLFILRFHWVLNKLRRSAE